MIRRPPRSTRMDTLFPYPPRCRAEDGRYRKAAHDEIADRQAKVVAGPEVAANRAAEPVEVLEDQRPVETILPTDVFHVRLRTGLAGPGHGRITRKPQCEETDERNADDQDRKSTRLNHSQ